jgi:phosphoglycolate phosphatase-like HAD superfamily hydrolase
VRDTVVLFDVDQTLLYSGGAGSLAMGRAFTQLYGVEDAFRRVEFTGRTDWSILRAAMLEHGLLDGAGAFEQEMARFLETYLALLEPTLREVEGGRVMPGVPELLAALAEREGVHTGLATGNFRAACFLKLRHFGLGAHLREGGFGDDAEDRGDLVRVAIERVANGAPADPRDVWVIGDTVLDVSAAQANNARSLAVATGSTPPEALRNAGADIVIDDLSDTEAVLTVLLG